MSDYLEAIQKILPAVAVVEEETGNLGVEHLYPEEAELVVNAVDKRKHEFIAGRIAARRGLKQFALDDFPILKGKHGEPLWPQGLVGSITHTADFRCCAVSSNEDLLSVGIDAEVIQTPDKELLQLIALPDEIAWLKRQATAEQTELFTLLFSAKEAFYKCQYPLTGRWLEFHDVSIDVVTKAAVMPGLLSVSVKDTGLNEIANGSKMVGRYIRAGDLLLSCFYVPTDTYLQQLASSS